MKINGQELPRELKVFFWFTWLIYFVGLFCFVPLIIYLVKPFLNYVVQGTPIAVSQAKALSFEKLCYFVTFASFWISSVLWLQKFIHWYRKVRN